jgi:hypothetical protein
VRDPGSVPPVPRQLSSHPSVCLPARWTSVGSRGVAPRSPQVDRAFSGTPRNWPAPSRELCGAFRTRNPGVAGQRPRLDPFRGRCICAIAGNLFCHSFTQGSRSLMTCVSERWFPLLPLGAPLHRNLGKVAGFTPRARLAGLTLGIVTRVTPSDDVAYACKVAGSARPRRDGGAAPTCIPSVLTRRFIPVTRVIFPPLQAAALPMGWWYGRPRSRWFRTVNLCWKGLERFRSSQNA